MRKQEGTNVKERESDCGHQDDDKRKRLWRDAVQQVTDAAECRLLMCFTFLKKGIRFSRAKGGMTAFGLALGERRGRGGSFSSGSKPAASISTATHKYIHTYRLQSFHNITQFTRHGIISILFCMKNILTQKTHVTKSLQHFSKNANQLHKGLGCTDF